MCRESLICELHGADVVQRRVKHSVIVGRQLVNYVVHCLPADFKPHAMWPVNFQQLHILSEGAFDLRPLAVTCPPCSKRTCSGPIAMNT